MKAGWEYIALSSVCKVQNGFAFNSKLFNESNNGLPLIRIRDIKRGYSLTYTSEICSDEFFVEDGDMLIGMDGDFNIGEWKGGHALLNQRVCKLIPSEKILAKFIFYFIPEALQRINDKTAFSTVKHLSSKQVNAILLPNLPLSKQQSIVDYLDSAFAKIDAMKANAEKALNEAKALFQASLKEILEPKEGWEEKRVGDVIDYLRTGLNPRTHFKLNTPGADGYYITVRELKGFAIEPDNKTDRVNAAAIKRINERSNLKIGDVLFSGTGTIGKTALVSKLPNNWNIKEGVYAMTPKHSELDSKYFIYYIGSDFFLRLVNDKAAGTGVRSIPMKELVKLPISVPHLSEQQSIVDTLDSLKSKVDRLQENYNKTSQECDALKQAILRQVFE